MSKSYLGTLSLITSFLITVCAIFIVPEAIFALGFDSIKAFFGGFLNRIGEFNVLIFTAFVGILLMNILLKCINIAVCKKLFNAPVFILDLAFIVCAFLVLSFSPVNAFLFVFILAVLAIMFDFLFFYAQM